MTITSARNDARDEAAKEAQRRAHFNPTILTLPDTEISMLKKNCQSMFVKGHALLKKADQKNRFLKSKSLTIQIKGIQKIVDI